MLLIISYSIFNLQCDLEHKFIINTSVSTGWSLVIQVFDYKESLSTHHSEVWREASHSDGLAWDIGSIRGAQEGHQSWAVLRYPLYVWEEEEGLRWGLIPLSLGPCVTESSQDPHVDERGRWEERDHLFREVAHHLTGEPTRTQKEEGVRTFRGHQGIFEVMLPQIYEGHCLANNLPLNCFSFFNYVPCGWFFRNLKDRPIVSAT